MEQEPDILMREIIRLQINTELLRRAIEYISGKEINTIIKEIRKKENGNRPRTKPKISEE